MRCMFVKFDLLSLAALLRLALRLFFLHHLFLHGGAFPLLPLPHLLIVYSL